MKPTKPMFEYFNLRGGDQPPDLGFDKPFKCLVLIREDVTDTWRVAMSRWLVASGCLYMMAWGRDCILWDDSVDCANIEKFPGDIPDDKFVITSWHNDETLEDVVDFATFSANHSRVPLETLVVLDIGPDSRKDEIAALIEKCRREALEEAAAKPRPSRFRLRWLERLLPKFGSMIMKAGPRIQTQNERMPRL
ncbi:hypothetical protein K1W69_10765 [Hoeflea sp. WL0058]|uniref:DUF7684 domain-containing protein n=1 Tax=Flavimaribacter sediminis TaxID=2865987 RepID=A0AAE2ZJF9_9HYPH|nr:hypothetical protein [Flavimaribacter sediminis]MBW8637668.1 hypothetical protein [Flavimaribacter sediminis]